MFKFLIVLCLGVLAVQAKPQELPELEDQFDDLLRELNDLQKEAGDEQRRSVEKIKEEVRSLEDLGQQVLHNLEDELHSDVATFLVQLSSLEEKARELGVDIHQCVGNSLDEVSELPERQTRESQECVGRRTEEVEHQSDEVIDIIDKLVHHVDEYRGRVDRCRDAERREQEICVAELQSEIRKDSVELPSLLHLAVDEFVGHTEALKGTLLECVAGKSEAVLHEGERIVGRVTECAERLFPPGPGPHPPQ